MRVMQFWLSGSEGWSGFLKFKYNLININISDSATDYP